MRAFLTLLVVASAVTADAQRRRLPRGVQILRYGQGIHGVGSPTGQHFAYWGQRGFEVYDLAEQRRIRVDEAPQLGAVTCSVMGWAPDGRKVAFTFERGVAEFDLDTGRVRTVHRDPPESHRTDFCAVAYDVHGRVMWTRQSREGAALFREGADPIPFPQGFGAGRFALLAFGPTAGAQRLLVANRDSHRATLLDFVSTRFEPLHGEFARPYADRAGRRLCYSSDGDLRCRELLTGRDVALGEGSIVGTMEANPFSPSGQRMVFRRGEQVLAHDFVTGQQQVVSRLALPGGSFAYRGIAFSGEEHVLFFEHHQELNRRGPAIRRVHLPTGSSHVLLRDEQQHCYAEVVDETTVFVFRTNRGGGEDLTRVHFEGPR